MLHQEVASWVGYMQYIRLLKPNNKQVVCMRILKLLFNACINARACQRDCRNYVNNLKASSNIIRIIKHMLFVKCIHHILKNCNRNSKRTRKHGLNIEIYLFWTVDRHIYIRRHARLCLTEREREQSLVAWRREDVAAQVFAWRRWTIADDETTSCAFT